MLRQIKALCGIDRIGAVGRAEIMRFKAKRLDGKVSPATVNKDLRQLRSVLSYAVDGGYLRANPLLRWRGLMLKEPEKQIRVVEADEFVKLRAATANPGLRALLVTAYFQGLRRTELANLRWSSVDLERRILHVINVPEENELTKSRKNRHLPMDAEVYTALAQLWADTPRRLEIGGAVAVNPFVFTWPNGEPFKVDWLTHEFETLVDDAKIAPCTLHDLRRSFSTIAQRAGVDRSIVKDLGGWSSLSVVEKHYSGNIQPAYEAAMEKIRKARTA